MNMTTGQIRELVENPGMAIRAPATAVMTIDSRDRVKVDANGYRVDTTSPYEIYINKQQTLMNGYFTRLGMTEINMQWGIPNVNQTNNTLLLEQGAAIGPGAVIASYVLTILPGFYTAEELADAIQDKLVADNVFGTAAWGCTWDERNNRFSLADVGGTVFFRIHPRNQGSSDDLCNMMGFSYPTSSFGHSVFGSYACMQYTPYFDVVSSNLTKKQNVRDNSTSFLTGQNLLCRVYLSEPGAVAQRDRTSVVAHTADTTQIGTRPFMLYREYSTPKQIYWDTKEFINVIDLRLVDYKGNTLYSEAQASQDVGTGESFCGDASQFQLTLQVTET